MIIIDLKIIFKKLLGLIDLAKILIFYIYKLIKIIMINKNKNCIFAVFLIIMLDFKNFDNR